MHGCTHARKYMHARKRAACNSQERCVLQLLAPAAIPCRRSLMMRWVVVEGKEGARRASQLSLPRMAASGCNSREHLRLGSPAN